MDAQAIDKHTLLIRQATSGTLLNAMSGHCYCGMAIFRLFLDRPCLASHTRVFVFLLLIVFGNLNAKLSLQSLVVVLLHQQLQLMQ